MTTYTIKDFPKSGIATIYICKVGRQKHHIVAMIELDVSEGRRKVKQYQKEGGNISFTAWLIKAISSVVENYDLSVAYLKGKRSAEALAKADPFIPFFAGFMGGVRMLWERSNPFSCFGRPVGLIGSLDWNYVLDCMKNAKMQAPYFSLTRHAGYS